ncbi:hypothetical protein [Flagellimonas sp. CMM7]|uniref:hypothetical protein n=1 Tax=Flagellimonas sp. CMM7 TaxID=2654676 RepID=UPI0013D3C49B|nr:hypothetical protein [Flagellimonas sp. CMM7]UII79555.1 hypothetical protein LV704_18080 [Flagellimonas sp. CMM7]
MRTITNISLLPCFIFLFIGCSNDSDDNNQVIVNSNGSIEELREYYNASFVNAMVAIGFTINQGNTPPSLDGSYLIDPFVLEDSTIPGDEDNIGEGTGNYQITFSNQDNTALTIDLVGTGGNQVDEGNGSFVTGTNGKFSVFAKTTTQLGSANAVTAVAISGTLTADGIDNVNFFGAMLDDKGDPQNIFIENNAGRFYLDGDGNSPKVSSQSDN